MVKAKPLQKQYRFLIRRRLSKKSVAGVGEALSKFSEKSEYALDRDVVKLSLSVRNDEKLADGGPKVRASTCNLYAPRRYRGPSRGAVSAPMLLPYRTEVRKSVGPW